MQNLLAYANTEGGKYLLSELTDRKRIDGRIVHLSPSSYHVLKQNRKVEAHFFCGDYVLAKLAPVLLKMDIARETGYEAFLHHAGLKPSPRFSHVYLDSLTYNPSAGDGSLRAHDGGTWSSLRTITDNGTPGGATVDNNTGTDSSGLVIEAAESDRFYCRRGYFPFDTSSIPDTASIEQSGTKFRVYVTAKTDNDDLSVALTGTTQSSVSSLATSDYSALTVNSPTEYATRINVTSLSTSAYNDFEANASLVAYISKTGNTKLGLRSSADVDNSAPTDNTANDVTVNFSESGSNKPELIVVYSLGGGFYYMSV